MSKGFWRTILIILLIGFGLFLLWRLISPRFQGLGAPTSGSVNVDLADALPDSWFVISGNWSDQCDFDATVKTSNWSCIATIRRRPPAPVRPPG